MPEPTEMQDYLFDLQGFLVLKGAVSADELAALNAEWTDGHPHEKASYRMGPTFASIIDHPSWIEHIRRYIGGDDGIRMHQAIAARRPPGKAALPHSGAHKRRIYTQFRYHDGQFRCGQINIIMAHHDIGPGDGCTVVVPGSHKANLQHPQFHFDVRGESMDDIVAAHPVHLDAGDAVLFVDCLAHGAETRRNPGLRKVSILRYGPKWSLPEGGRFPATSFLESTTEARRKLLEPVPIGRLDGDRL
jgi:hypothetical protein